MPCRRRFVAAHYVGTPSYQAFKKAAYKRRKLYFVGDDVCDVLLTFQDSGADDGHILRRLYIERDRCPVNKICRGACKEKR